MEELVCPICDTSNSPDAIHCEVCGERLVPEEVGGEAADQLSSAGGEVVGFAIEDSEEADADDVPFGATDAAEEEPSFADAASEPAAIEEDGASDITDEELMTAAPADETATMDSFDAGDSVEHEVDDSADEVFEEATGGMTMDSDEMEPSDAQHDVDAADGIDELSESQFDDEHAEEAGDAAGEEEGPEYLYSPEDGTAYPRGSAEYEEGFGPNGEELVATPPDSAFDQLEQDFGDDADLDVSASLGEASGASMDDAELAAAAAPSPTVSAEFQAAFQARRKERPAMAPLPQPGAYTDPAVLTVYANRQPVMRLAIDMDEVLIGRRDPVADSYPDLDLTDLDPEAHLSRKHAYIYRQNKNYTLYAVSNAGTQLNADLLDLGDRRALSDGDVIVLAGKIAMKFELPKA